MRLVRLIAMFALVLPLAWSVPAAAIEAGKDYLALSPAQPGGAKGKIEVIEFFAYTCPHCFELEPDLHNWAKKLPRNVVLKRQPVVFADNWEPMARVYFALESMGAIDRLHADVFNALHVDDIDLRNPETFFDWGAKKGLDRAKLKSAYQSFAVGAKIARAKQLQSSYKLNGVPALAVNGKYLTNGTMAGGLAQSLDVTSALIRKESAGKRSKK
jgi:thiol:disulfide interchange protein DsbA